MKWKGRRGSRNVIDNRRGGARAAVGGGGIGVLLIVVIGYFLGVDLTPLMGQMDGQQPAASSAPLSEADIARGEFASVVLADTEEVWARIFAQQVGERYAPPQLELFSGQTNAGACGFASSATGPFYCPANKRAYLDTDFFVTLERQLGAGGDFAAAYVIAHEVAHHIQNQLGILGQANRIRAQVSEAESNAISVRIELQADCYSGIWAREVQRQFGTLERGDIEEAMNAAARIGDDTLQRRSGRAVRPDSFTHGSSEQRQRWFARGFDSGDMNQCDTFSATRL